MPFYVMKQDTLIPGSVALGGLPAGIDPSDWLTGQPLPALPVGATLTLSAQSGDYFGSVIGAFLPLFHTSLKQALDDFGVDNVQYCPINLYDPNFQDGAGRTITRYVAANVIGRFDCLDREKSQLRAWPSGRGYDLLSTVIDADKTAGRKIFRLHDDPTLIIIDESLKQRLVDELNVLVGVDIIRTEDYSRW